MQRKLTVILDDDERMVLEQMAAQELRFPETQLRALIRDAAQTRGLWPPQKPERPRRTTKKQVATG